MRLVECVRLAHQAGLLPPDVVFAQGTAMAAWYDWYPGFREPTDADVLFLPESFAAASRSGNFFRTFHRPTEGAWSRFTFETLYPYNPITGQVDTRLEIGNADVEPYGIEIPGPQALWERARPFPVSGLPTYRVISREDVRTFKEYGRRRKDKKDIEVMSLIDQQIALDVLRTMQFNEYPINVVRRPMTKGGVHKLECSQPPKWQGDDAGNVHLPRQQTLYCARAGKA